jgi:beta-carotene hydroxylase
MLRFKADIRTLVFMGVTTALLFIQWTQPEFHPALFVAACLMAVSVTAIAHNHNHLGIWKSDFLNGITDYWITLFYGYPAFAWIPTHNMNHHVYNNKEQDYTATYKISENNNLLTLLAYPTYSGMVQQKANVEYVKSLWIKDRKKWVHCMLQVSALVLFYAVALFLNWKKALLYIIIPHQVGLNAVLVFNYIQHVHANEDSAFDHSRNVVGWGMNAFLFNNGFHTVHHMYPKKHWSLAPIAHDDVKNKINPKLNEQSFLWFMFRTYILSIFIPKYRTVPMNPKVRGNPLSSGELIGEAQA